MPAVVITSITQKTKEKIRLLLDNGEVWILYTGELRALHLQEGDTLPEQAYEHIRREVLLKRAKKRAMHLLERMDRTREQLRRKLLEGEYPPDLVEEALEYVSSYHYLDDARYADTYVRIHGDLKSSGRLRMELLHKGIASELIDRALEAQEGERDEEAMIRALMEKRHFDPETSDVSQRRRMYAYLQRRGFRSTDISRLLHI